MLYPGRMPLADSDVVQLGRFRNEVIAVLADLRLAIETVYTAIETEDGPLAVKLKELRDKDRLTDLQEMQIRLKVLVKPIIQST